MRRNFCDLIVKELGQHLTLDGLRLQRQKKFADKNEEARLIRRFYYTPIRRRLEFE